MRDGRARLVNETMRRVCDGPRRRRMIRGTIARIGELAMRYGHPSQLAILDCTSSRRSTVMRALPRATVVTTEYQRDSSSKRPRSSVVSAVRTDARPECQIAGAASRASRPVVGAPGPRVRDLTRTLLCRPADACRRVPSRHRTRGAYMKRRVKLSLQPEGAAFLRDTPPVSARPFT
jgi:hypothetical protein